MKIKPYYIILILTLFACSKDGDNIIPIESFDPISISFVYQDGTAIEPGDCLSPDVKYAIQIETIKNTAGNTQVSQVEYTVNDTLFSLSFSQAGIKRNPITFVDGKNIAELVTTVLSTELYYIGQDDFELVE
jgi:hypothetical protein